MSETEGPSPGVEDKVVFLLGAGASVDAGIPHTVGMVDGFESEMLDGLDEDLRELYELIADGLRRHLRGRGRKLDIESLLNALAQLEQRDDQPLAPFVAQWEQEFDTWQVGLLSRSVREYLQRKCHVAMEKTEYLRPLKFFIDDQGKLDLFSLNYDMCVEQVCHFYEIPYTDGFSATWDPELFKAERFKVRLHKIHGSVSWFRTRELKSRLVRVPTAPGGEAQVATARETAASATHFTGFPLEEILVYPVIAKETHVDPHATLLERLRAALRNNRFLLTFESLK